VVARAPGILAGVPVAAWVFLEQDGSLQIRVRLTDGARVRRGTVILTVQGSARSILAAERTALNVLAHLSGVATLTDRLLRRARPARPRLLDTRKTLPGLRALEKYAVRVGGGASHRADLAGALLIKRNHLRALKASLPHGRRGTGAVVREALARARARAGRRFVEIEVETPAALRAALAARPDAILLDNWTPRALRAAVRARRGSVLLEASGGITAETIRAVARSGVDRLSVGCVTHSAPALDVALEVG
jgi:nicotinate-nucleotide pyrophosphorylase (carboxylating)